MVQRRTPAADWFDDSDWPLLRVTFPGTQTDAELKDYFQLLRGYRNRRVRYAVMLDGNQSLGFSPQQRKMHADYLKEGLAIPQHAPVAIAFVAGSPLRRGVLTAVFWFVKPSSPYEIFETTGEAERWLKDRLNSRIPRAADGPEAELGPISTHS
jgi:hypothetical protein